MGPVLIHIITQKGKGYLPAETASDKMHGVGPYNPKDGKSISKPSSKPKVLLCPDCFETRDVCVPISSERDVSRMSACDFLAKLLKPDGGFRLLERYESAACLCYARENQPRMCVKTHRHLCLSDCLMSVQSFVTIMFFDTPLLA